jgi:anaerobic magnesium-protoporphyrin IX monomethyl ester cyclase
LADGGIHQNAARPLRPVDMFRAHDYRLIPVERYFALKGRRQLDFITSQGCNFRCAFCSDPFVYGRKWVGLDPASIGTRLEELWQRYRFGDVNFQDETFFTRRDRVQAMAEHIVDTGLKFTWAATMRADQGARLPAEAWARCKQSGLRRLLVGVESGSNEMLQRIRKDTTIEAVMQTAQTMVQFDIGGIFPFIVGFPDESNDSVAASLAVAKQLRAMSPRFETPFFYFKPYPGSEIVIEAVARGFRLPTTLESWSEFDYVAGLPGPWVSREKYRLIERFKFFQDLAWKPARRRARLLQRMARYRLSRDEYRWPLEMQMMRLGPQGPKLS